ncbi:unnamed protein product [Fusarium equiseti]|uniref:Zn(2)-C6 fungal-type domain-containing protein n=1 Tax=Fusarium equiseti TaxID=61235 RepID=A0A8J2IHE3_FUSEQ|nr:unnamed protein product [Fusarium equiseti]
MGEGAQRREASYRSACTECARRKQKCNREWPCNGCQKRKVADKCRFKDTNQLATEKPVDRQRKNRLISKNSPDSIDSEFEDTANEGINALGYMPSHLLFDLTSKYETMKATSQEFLKEPKSFPQLERALRIVPSKPYADILVQNFLNNVNYHYYIIYPPSFIEQYQGWWASRAENRPLSVQWTCLLLTVCACASQYTDVELQSKLEAGLGDPIHRITEQYHEAARELASSVPLGHSHLINVQQLLHSCYWFKSEARFIECWHVLNSAIREAQELSIHKETKAGPITEFELEMRRRIWCILDTWDWQISTLLGRPLIIDRKDCDVDLPTLSLEGYQHSPLAHMKIQSGLIRQISGKFGHTKDITAHADVQGYQRTVETWISSFPPPLILHDEQHTLPRREDVYKAIDEAHAILQSMRMVTKSAKASYGILTRIVQRLPRTSRTYSMAGKSSEAVVPQVPEAATSPQVTLPVTAPYPHNSLATATFSPSPINIPTPGIPSPVYSLSNVPTMAGDFAAPAAYNGLSQCGDWQSQLYMQDPATFAPTHVPTQDTMFANISDEELGELANVWNYQSLDFSFISS